MEAARERGARLFAICNVLGSQATRISEGVVYTHAGPEIGVASTKAFTTQLVALYLFALYLRQQRGSASTARQLASLAHLPQAVDEALARAPARGAGAAPFPRRRLPLPRRAA
jgi:glucosamine--fructose-6-phosphate aminotransferase (isomerizing)